MKLVCPDCGHRIKSDDININALVAKCARCDSIFGFEYQVKGQSEGALASPGVADSDVELALPKGLSIENEGDRLTITRRWFSCSALPILGFAAIWDTFLVFWYAQASQLEGGAGLLTMIFPLLHVAIGIGVTYFGVANVINRTLIVADKETIKISHQPLPWRGGRTVYAAAIKQLYVHREETRRSRSGQMSEVFSVHALLADQASVPLVEGLKSRFQALFIEQELERQLGIKAAVVQGEYAPAPHELRNARARPVGVSLSLPDAAQDELSLPESELEQSDD